MHDFHYFLYLGCLFTHMNIIILCVCVAGGGGGGCHGLAYNLIASTVLTFFLSVKHNVN